MRIQLTGNYTQTGTFELRKEDGSLHLAVEPNQVLRIGNSIGGYWAKPVQYAGQQMLALVRIGGSKVGLSADRLRREFGKERGTLLQPGQVWAASSGAARRGVWHRIREDADPIRNALRSLGLPSNLVRTVDQIGETVYEGGRFDRGGADRSWFMTDGTSMLLSEEHEEDVPQHLGGRRAFTRQEHRVSSGTYLITGQDWSREDCRFASPVVSGVFVTPKADREFVAKMARASDAHRRYEAVEAVEVEYGLRCPVCKREGCNLASHEAEEVSKVAQEKAARDRAEVIELDGEKYRLLATEKFGRHWSYGAKALERVSDNVAFVRVGWTGEVKPASEHRSPTVTDEKSGLCWEAPNGGGGWKIHRSAYPSIVAAQLRRNTSV